jgi:pimeloyl-ACP methyl ester carboxylesterase
MTIGTDTHHWRSPLLGEPKHLDLPCGRVDYFERGSGTTLLFVHGWLANANLWRNVIGDLASDFRCIAIDMPLGAHRTALRPDADLTPAGCATIIRGAIRALGLDRPTLVGNDSGGAYSQMVAAAEPDRVGRLILNACETPFDAFPPPPFDGLPAVATDPTQLGTLFQALRDPELRISDAAFGLLIKHPLDADVSDSYALPCVTNPGVLHDIAKVIAATTPDAHHAAGQKLIATLQAPVLFAWNREDKVFPPAHAQRYADQLADASFVAIEDSYAFTPEDQPALLAQAIRTFHARHKA